MLTTARKLSARGFEIQIKKILLRWMLGLKLGAWLKKCARDIASVPNACVESGEKREP